MTTGIRLVMSEWQTLSPENCPELVGKFLSDTAEVLRVVATINKRQLLSVTELKNGVTISARSHVGQIRLGDIQVTIRPKLNLDSMLRLLRYAFGLRRLSLFATSDLATSELGFEDLLICQLNAEAQELISRGLRREYTRRSEQLASPRGRILVNQLAQGSAASTATLPCEHYPRVEDIQLNRILMAGLRYAASIASSLTIRRESRRLSDLMAEQVKLINLSQTALGQAWRKVSRLTSAYEPALKIITLLLESKGVVLEGGRTQQLPGFLFDMNIFFQELLSRFLNDNLSEFTVQDEHRLKQMMSYNPKYNPKRRMSPTPRPDNAVKRKDRVVALLDAKYRDLWNKSLPREMLYQLVVYAISDQRLAKSAILYPTLDKAATESRVDVRDPVRGNPIGQVHLRPVDLNKLDQLVSKDAPAIRTARVEMAKLLAFGST